LTIWHYTLNLNVSKYNIKNTLNGLRNIFYEDGNKYTEEKNKHPPEKA
jgi:hypothetical protein